VPGRSGSASAPIRRRYREWPGSPRRSGRRWPSFARRRSASVRPWR
jgi:hypothetical protein